MAKTNDWRNPKHQHAEKFQRPNIHFALADLRAGRPRSGGNLYDPAGKGRRRNTFQFEDLLP